jgi:uncharacterized cupredoxin-like copper-binding protein
MHRQASSIGFVAAPLLVALVLLAGCEGGAAPPTPPVVPGASDRPREVNIIARDYAFLPATVDLVPGETVLLHVINGGLEIHEAVLGDAAVQDAWEAAEAATVGHPPGPTPVVRVPPEVEGIRLVVDSGERVDLLWTVPADVGSEAWVVGCHIPGHWERGMQVPVRWVAPASSGAAARVMTHPDGTLGVRSPLHLTHPLSTRTSKEDVGWPT